VRAGRAPAVVLAYFFPTSVGPGLRQGFGLRRSHEHLLLLGATAPAASPAIWFCFFHRLRTPPWAACTTCRSYSVFKMNPLPYHLVRFCLLLFNTWLAFPFFALLLTESRTRRRAVRVSGGLSCGAVSHGVSHVVHLRHFCVSPSTFLAFNYYLTIRARWPPIERSGRLPCSFCSI